MMEKLLTFPGRTDKGIFTFVIDQQSDHLIKTASAYHPEIAAYIRNAKKIPGKTQILLTALGAYEYWGSNVNGDGFHENQLAHPGPDYGYTTFKTMAKVYKHHINKDPKASYGDVVVAVYNPTYHRVELIVVVDNARAGDITGRIERGEYPEWSMGCRVPYDVCSNCGNKAPKVEYYCDCLKYHINQIHPETGKFVYAINIKPKFFDISYVLIGADKVAKTLMKVASPGNGGYPQSALAAAKMASSEKSADIEKEVPVKDAPASQEAVETLARAIPEVKASEPALPKDTLDSLGRMPLKDVFSTLPLLGIVPKPQEFQRIILISLGRKNEADQLDKHNMCFDPQWVPEPSDRHMNLVDMGGFPSERVIHMMRPHMPSRSYAAPFLAKRITIMVKRANEQKEDLPNFMKLPEEREPVGILPLLMVAAGMYAAFGKKAPGQAVGKIDKFIADHPVLAGALAAGAPMAFNEMAGPNVKGKFDYTDPENPDRTDIFSRIEERKQKPYLKIAAPLLGPASKRLFLGIPAVYMASGIMQKHRQANPYEQEGRIKSFIRKNPDIIGAALAADAMMALKGKGSAKHLGKLKDVGAGFWNKAKESLKGFSKHSSDLEKTASAQDFLTNALIWPVAFGGANLPGRIIGGLVDQAVLESSKQLLSKKKQQPKMNP